MGVGQEKILDLRSSIFDDELLEQRLGLHLGIGVDDVEFTLVEEVRNLLDLSWGKGEVGWRSTFETLVSTNLE